MVALVDDADHPASTRVDQHALDTGNKFFTHLALLSLAGPYSNLMAETTHPRHRNFRRTGAIEFVRIGSNPRYVMIVWNAITAALYSACTIIEAASVRVRA